MTRLGRCIGAAALLVMAATAFAKAGEAAHDNGQAAPPAANASDKAAPAHGEHPAPVAATRRGADRKDDVTGVARGANPPLDRRSKLGAPDPGDMRVAPAVRQIPRLSARDRLFRLMLAKPKPAARLRPPNLAAPSPPMRNAIGIRIDPGAAARTATMAHGGQRPARPATVGTMPMAVPPSAANAWHPVAVPAPAARGALNGTGLVRAGSGAPVIGGPAKAVTGINGTTLRPKHQ